MSINAFIATSAVRKSLAGFLAKLLARSPRHSVVLAVTLGIFMAVLGGELLTPPPASLGAFAFFPVVIGGWFLAARTATIVVGLALVVRFIGVLGGVHLITAVAEAAMLVAMGIGAALAAARFRQWKLTQVRLHAQAAERAAAAERERIAEHLTHTLIRTVFAATLDLHAALAFTDHEVVRQRIESASKKLDDEITNIRGTVFMVADTRAISTARTGGAPTAEASWASD